MRTWAREELHHELPLLLLAGFLFNFASNVYNISYVPFLYAGGLGAASIFLVNLSNNVAQTLVFPITGGLSNRLGPDKLVRQATYLRSLGYLATAGFTFVVLTGPGAFGANLAVYAVLGGAVAVYTTASSLMLFRGLASREAGSVLGVNSALGGAAAVLGAAFSGILSVYGSYRLVFLVAGGSLLASLPIWTAASVAYARRKKVGASPTPPSRSVPSTGSVPDPRGTPSETP